MTEPKKRGNYLSVTQQFNLHHACRLLTAAWGHCTYLVGSSLDRPNYRDVDLRCILPDEEYDAFIGKNETKLLLLNTALSEYLSARTNLPIDFQFQRRTEANEKFDGLRYFVGFPLLEADTWNQDEDAA